MPKSELHTARVSIDQKYVEELRNLPWGMRTKLLRVCLELVLEFLRVGGDSALGALMHGRIKLAAREDDA